MSNDRINDLRARVAELERERVWAHDKISELIHAREADGHRIAALAAIAERENLRDTAKRCDDARQLAEIDRDSWKAKAEALDQEMRDIGDQRLSWLAEKEAASARAESAEREKTAAHNNGNKQGRDAERERIAGVVDEWVAHEGTLVTRARLRELATALRSHGGNE